jgi:hypothetical protein
LVGVWEEVVLSKLLERVFGDEAVAGFEGVS